MNDSEHDEVSQKLRVWKVELKIPAGFQREVWQRVAVRQTAREVSRPSVIDWLGHQIFRPTFALGLLMVSLTAGITYAHERAQRENARSWKQLETRYAASIDPVAMNHDRE